MRPYYFTLYQPASVKSYTNDLFIGQLNKHDDSAITSEKDCRVLNFNF